MGIKERREREKDELRELILNAAEEIAAESGIENLSIRKIASRIEYSPAIIYHYFRDKDEIINILMDKGYKHLLEALSETESFSADPVKRFRDLLRKYIYTSLQMGDIYKSVQLNGSTEVLRHTSVLSEGASVKRQALGILVQSIKNIYQGEKFDDNLAELTAQIIYTSTFGLIIRLVIEKDTTEEQRNRLIEHHINLITEGILGGKSLIEM